jgi:hypothetical protein
MGDIARPGLGRPGVEVRGVIAMNGMGQLCFFAHSRAEGLPLLDDGGSFLATPDELRRAITEAPSRRTNHRQLAKLDPIAMGGEAFG